MKKSLAHKSVGALIALFLLGPVALIDLRWSYAPIAYHADEIPLLVAVVAFFDIILIALAVGLTLLILWIIMLPTPLVASDEKGIYLYQRKKPETFIPYTDIVNVVSRPFPIILGIAALFGRLTITTKTNTYKLHWVAGINKVVNNIVQHDYDLDYVDQKKDVL